MAEARCDQAWSHTSAVLAMLANLHRDPKKIAPFQLADFHPYRRRKPKAPPVGIQVLKQVFVDSQTR